MTHGILTRRDFLAQGGKAAFGLALGAAAGLPGSARAQAYPSQNIEWIIYQSPGGLIDTSTRTLQPYLEAQGFNTVLKYVRGASGRIARTELYKAKPDGYTIMTEASPEEVLGEVIYKADYKVAEFEPVYGWFINAFNLYVQKASEIKTFKQLLETAQKKRMTVATIGKGGPSHLQLAILKSRLKMNLEFVHFAGGTPAYTALAGGHVDLAIGGSSSVRYSDTVNFVGVFRNGRDPALPDVPTMAELGHAIPPINEVIYANAGPKVPADRLQKLAAAFDKAVRNPEHIEKQKKLGVFPTPMTAAELKKMVGDMYTLVNEHRSELEG
ncbi:MAG: tripartite tricarboxylate transporter substrate binding protein [Proteobacteria bacterium]|nr:tripartite tricarboxylate transporter substrate binding protein [Pseudomonadota bacterium]